MSHFTKLTAEIKDLEVLTSAVQKMGFSIAQNADCRYFYGKEKRDFVIKLPGRYDVAVNRENSNKYSLEADFFAGEVSKYLGSNCNILMQQYSAEKVKIEAFQRGLNVTEESTLESTKLTLTDQETGGQIFVTCYLGGKTEIKTAGFQGQSCMKFKEIEEALGSIESTTLTDEFYMKEKETGVETIKTSI